MKFHRAEACFCLEHWGTEHWGTQGLRTHVCMRKVPAGTLSAMGVCLTAKEQVGVLERRQANAHRNSRHYIRKSLVNYFSIPRTSNYTNIAWEFVVD